MNSEILQLFYFLHNDKINCSCNKQRDIFFFILSTSFGYVCWPLSSFSQRQSTFTAKKKFIIYSMTITGKGICCVFPNSYLSGIKCRNILHALHLCNLFQCIINWSNLLKMSIIMLVNTNNQSLKVNVKSKLFPLL